MEHISIMQSDGLFGNFCWPSVARLFDGRLIAVCSGNRLAHVCPFGKVVTSYSEDEGRTWSEPTVLIDTPLDDRDAGITPYRDGFIITTFNNTRAFQRSHITAHPISPEKDKRILDRLDQITDEDEETYFGASYYIFDKDGKETLHGYLPISSPHGMTVLADGRLMYVGRMAAGSRYADVTDFNRIGVMFSEDGGLTFGEVTWIDLRLDRFPKTAIYCEPHGIGLADGRILIQYRLEGHGEPFTVHQSVSTDGGKSFTVPEPLSIPEDTMSGSPPHMLQTKNGDVILTYGYRLKPYGQRARISHDGGATWGREIILRDDGLNWDLGYPATVELRDGKLLTLYYQIPVGKENRAILATIWDYNE